MVAAAALIHLPALVLVLGATGAVRSTATKGTVRMLVGLFGGLATWIIAGVVLADGAGAWIAGVTVVAEGALALDRVDAVNRSCPHVWGRLRVPEPGRTAAAGARRAGPSLSDAVREAAGV